MMRNCPSITGRILTVLSLVFLVILSFSVIAPTAHASSNSLNLQKRTIQARQRSSSATDPPDSPTSSARTSSRSISRPSPSSAPRPPPSPAPAPDPAPPPAPLPPPPTTASPTIQPLPPTSFLPDPTLTTPTTTPPDGSSPDESSPPTTQTFEETSLSSSSTTTFSSIVAIVTPIAVPKTTFSVPTSTFFPKTSSSDPEPTATSQALKKTFWENKGAVVATFTITSLVIFAVFLVIIMIVIRRRNIRNQPNDEYFEKYNENSVRGADFADDVSTHNLTAPAGTDAYPDRQIHYGSDPNASAIYRQDARSQGHEQDVGDMYTPDEYGIHYPPGTAYSTDQEQEYSPGRHARSLSDPANYERDETGLVPPVAFREPIPREHVGRDSYQQSIDSFYIAQAR